MHYMQDTHQCSGNVGRTITVCIILRKIVQVLKYYRKKMIFFPSLTLDQLNIVVQVPGAGNICVEIIIFSVSQIFFFRSFIVFF